MAINLGNVSISLRQFQDISSGKYNAGEVKLTSETGIDKVNNHVTMKFLNTTKISHEEVLAIKNSFVRALKSGGVGGDELNRIRQELGLAPTKPVDKDLHARSIKPLSRQQIRDILDRNAATINRHAGEGTVRTSQEIHAGTSEQTLASRKASREAVNAELGARRDIVENKSINNLQAVLAGDVDFVTSEGRRELLETARECLDAVLVGCNASPRDVKASVQWTAPGGKSVVLPSGLTEKALVRKLEDIIVRLGMNNCPSQDELAFRDEFKALATPEERAAWAANLANDPKGAFKARAVAVMIMHDRGIDDAETLSVVNRLKNADAIAFAANLVAEGMDLEGDALRASAPVETALSKASPDANVLDLEKAYIPALTDRQFNEQVSSDMKYHVERLPATFQKLVQDTTFEVRARFGEAGFPDNATPASLTRSSSMTIMARANDPNASRLTVESLRGPFVREALETGAERVFQKGVAERLKEAGLDVKNPVRVSNALQAREPAVLQRILAAPTPQAADAVLDYYADVIADSARMLTACKRCEESLEGWAKEALAKKLGVPVQSLSGEGVNLTRLLTKGGALNTAICNRVNAASTDEEIEAEYKKLVDAYVGERTRLFDKIDASGVTAEAKAAAKSTVLALRKVDYIDIDRMVAAAKSISTDRLAGLLASNAPKDQVFDAMREINDAVTAVTNKAFEADAEAGKEVGPDELFGFTTVMMDLVVLSRPEMEVPLARFLTESVVGTRYADAESATYPAQPFMMALGRDLGAIVERSFLAGECAARAIAAGYNQSELPKIAKTFALYKAATNATDEAALAAALDPASKASRLMSYGGRFTESAEGFRAGLALMDKFAQWYANLSADVDGEKFDTPTKAHAGKTYVPANGLVGYELFVFQDLAIRPDIDLDEPDPERLFGIENNDAVNFFTRGNGSGCTGTLMKLSPAKRQVVYAAFKAVEPPVAERPGGGLSSLRDNGGYLARILRHFDEVASLMATGNLDRSHLNAILTPDLNLPPDATSREVDNAIQNRVYELYSNSPGKLMEVSSILTETGVTVAEAMEAVATGKKPAALDDISSTQMAIEQIDGTTNGGRKFMLGDLCRPSNVAYVGSGQKAIPVENCFFTVKIGGETIQCAIGDGNKAANAHIADKIESLCGKVHVEQANTVMRGLAQGAHAPIMSILPQHGIVGGVGAEHMALTYTLTKNDETGAVTIHYSEPKGFPFKFSWETTVALDGTSTTTPVVVDAP